MTDQPAEPQASVAVLTRDLFFGMRIRNALKQMGYTTSLKKTEQEFAEALGEPDCALAFVDFNNEVDWEAVRTTIDVHPDVAMIAFGSHTDTDSFRKAREAGVTRVISNGAFSQKLPDLIDRYARNK